MKVALDTLLFAPGIVEKLEQKTPPVSVVEVEEAFSQWDGFWVLDDRQQHQTIPPTYWFLSETYDGRLLKVVIKPVPGENYAYVRVLPVTAFDFSKISSSRTGLREHRLRRRSSA